MTPLVQKAGGFEGILPVLVIVGVIIAQIIKASKNLSRKGGDRRPPPPSAPGLGPGREPRDEIREFLAALTGEQPQPEPQRAPAPPPPPRAARVAAPARPVPQAPKPVIPAAEPAVSRKPAGQSARVGTTGVSRGDRREFSWDARGRRASAGISPARGAIVKGLSDRRALARAIVLKEILDAPLSLRSRS